MRTVYLSFLPLTPLESRAARRRGWDCWASNLGEKVDFSGVRYSCCSLSQKAHSARDYTSLFKSMTYDATRTLKYLEPHRHAQHLYLQYLREIFHGKNQTACKLIFLSSSIDGLGLLWRLRVPIGNSLHLSCGVFHSFV